MAAVAPQGQKPILVGLIAFGVLAIALGAVNLKRAIGPVRPAVSDTNAPTIPTTREELEAQQRGALAGLDTDGDGLSDLDELDRVRTSPFLADSDSDGKTDAEEVAAGTNPNCPEGKTCVEEPKPENANDMEDMSALSLEALGIELPSSDATPTRPVAPSPAVSAAMTPQELRSALIRQGVPSATVNALSDEQLMASYGSAITTFTTLPTGEPSPFADTLLQSFTGALRGGSEGSVAAALDALPKTPSAIRDALLRGGFPRERIQSIDDATLLKVWQQVIDDLKKQQSPSATP